MDDIADNNKDSIYQIAESKARPVSVDLRVSRIYRHLGSWRRRHATPQLAALQTMEMLLDGDDTKDS